MKQATLTRSEVVEWVRTYTSSAVTIQVTSPVLKGAKQDSGWVSLLFCELPGQRLIISLENKRLRAFHDAIGKVIEEIHNGTLPDGKYS